MPASKQASCCHLGMWVQKALCPSLRNQAGSSAPACLSPPTLDTHPAHRQKTERILTQQEVDSVQVGLLEQTPQLGLGLASFGLLATAGHPLPQHLVQVEDG